MSKGQKLRALVNERLTAAAAEIFELFERTIAEYEQEVLLLKQRNHKQLQQLEKVQRGPDSRRTESKLSRSGPPATIVAMDEESPNGVQIMLEHKDEVSPHLETPHIKEEPEEEQLQEFPFAPVSVKTEDDEDKSSVLHQRATEENREETNGEDCGAEAGCSSDPLTQLHSDSEEHTADHSEDWTLHWEPPAHTSATAELDLSSEPAAMNPDSSVTDVGGTGKPFRCSECGKGFQFNSALKKHVLVHTGEKPHKCSECGKGFQFISPLRKHMLIHTGQKPYTCSVCGKGFVDNSNFRRHERIHTGVKPFSCPFCEKEFTDKGNVKKHLRVHTGEKPFSCPVCKKEFSFLASYKRHVRIHRTETE